MVGEGIASILGLLRPLLEDRAKALLRAKSSDDRAKALSFQLYKQIRAVTSQSESYVRSLEDLGRTLRQHASTPDTGRKDFAESPDGVAIVEKASIVNDSVSLLTEELADLQEIVDSMAVQLEIHAPVLVEKVRRFDLGREESLEEVQHYYTEWRGAPKRLKAEWPRYLLTCRDEIWDIYVRANENQAMIESASEDLRGFLEKQFRFRESF